MKLHLLIPFLLALTVSAATNDVTIHGLTNRAVPNVSDTTLWDSGTNNYNTTYGQLSTIILTNLPAANLRGTAAAINGAAITNLTANNLAGAMPQVVSDRITNSSFLNVLHFGAVRDGVTECSAAFQAALNAASAFASFKPRPVFVPEGKYILTNTLIFPDNTTMYGPVSAYSYTLVGSDFPVARLVWSNALTTCIEMGTNMEARLENIVVDGSGLVTNGIHLYGASVVKDCLVRQCTVSGFHLGYGINSAIIDHCSANQNVIGLYSEGPISTTFTVRNSAFRENYQRGMLLGAGINVEVDSCVIESNSGDDGLAIIPVGTAPNYALMNIHFRNTWIEANSGPQVLIRGYAANWPTNIVFEDCRIVPYSVTNLAFWIDQVQKLTIIRPSFHGVDSNYFNISMTNSIRVVDASGTTNGAFSLVHSIPEDRLGVISGPQQFDSQVIAPSLLATYPALDNIPTNLIPVSTTAYTNYVFINWTNAGPVFVATNTAAAGKFILRHLDGTLTSWP